MKCCEILISSKNIISQNTYFFNVQICRFSRIFDIYVHKYVYFSVTMPNRLGRLTLFKHRLNGLNAKQRVTVCLPFSVQDNIELQFLRELRNISNSIPEKWLVIGDFNLKLQAQDKSNNNLNRRVMGEFKKAVDDLELKELKLKGRRFTWSNDTTQTRIDRAFLYV